MIGFRKVLYTANANHESENTINIMKINSIKVKCNLISGSFCDGPPSQIIHEFFPAVAAGYKIIKVPKHPCFMLLTLIQ